MNWTCPHFKELKLQELYDLMHLRQVVFVVEQNCPYADADGLDPKCWHPMGFKEGKLVACARIVPKGVYYADAIAIGRVLTSETIRGLGLGKELMQYSINKTKELFPDDPIQISAQTYLLRFYNELGFKAVGAEYLEDDIPHIKMVYAKKTCL